MFAADDPADNFHGIEEVAHPVFQGAAVLVTPAVDCLREEVGKEVPCPCISMPSRPASRRVSAQRA